MATIYRFIVEGVGTTDAKAMLDNNDVTPDGEIVPKRGGGSKGGGSLLAHNRGGVEHNRYMRPINPLMNRVTGGYWEKGQRVGRAMAQMPSEFANKGMGALGSVASLILIQFAIMEIDKWFREQQRKAKEENKSNYLKIVSGQTVIGQDYKVSKNIFGKINYGKQ
jgi:hypothetical protein